MDRRMLSTYQVYDQSYSGITLTDVLNCAIKATVYEQKTLRTIDNITGQIGDYRGLTDYKGCKPNQILVKGSDRYEIVDVINSTRQSQLVLKKLC